MYIHSVRLQNIKCFEDVAFEFGDGKGNYAGWNVFVGGNASGKSTLLKAIALAVAGPTEGRQLIVTTSGWIRQGENAGEIEAELFRDPERDLFYDKPPKQFADPILELSLNWKIEKKQKGETFFSGKHPFHLQLTNGNPNFTAPWTGNPKGWFCAAYGSMRRLSGTNPQDVQQMLQERSVLSRMFTLFREEGALSDSEEWLRNSFYKRVDEITGRIDHIEELIALKLPAAENALRLFQKLSTDVKAFQATSKQRRLFFGDGLFPQGLRISDITPENVLLESEAKIELPLRDLSDGCRSVFAFVLDLIRCLGDVYGTENLFTKKDGKLVIDYPGVVLIDEFEAHLHPAWQQSLPEWLKTHFPKIQFIVTTHSPLVAQAADEGGVYVLPLQNETNRQPRRLNEKEWQKVKLGFAGRVLLGEAFGLQSTRSVWAREKIERWKFLNSKRKAGAKLSKSETTEFNELQELMEIAFEEES